MICDSKHNGLQCTRDAGHDGLHRHISNDPKYPESSSTFIVEEWNHKGEGRIADRGMAFRCNYGLGREERQKIMNMAIHDAMKSLDEGDVFEIRTKPLPIAQDPAMMRSWGIAWYHIPKQPEGFESYDMAQSPLFQHDIDSGDHKLWEGYILVARIKV